MAVVVMPHVVYAAVGGVVMGQLGEMWQYGAHS